MGVTNDFGQKAFNKAGDALMEVYDSVLAAYRRPCRVRNVAYQPSSEKIQQRAPVKGIQLVRQERTTAIGGALTVTMAEQMAPEVSNLLFGDSSIDQTLTAADVYNDIIARTLYGTEVQFLTNEYGLVPDVDLGTVSAVATGTGSAALPALYFWVSAVWEKTGGTALTTTAGTTAWSAAIDIDRVEGAVMGTSSAVVAGFAGVTVATIATTGVTPDYWYVWGNTSDTIVGASLWAVVAGTSATTALMTTPVASTDVIYAAGVGIGVQTIASYSTGTAAYTKRVSGTDFTYNSANGTIKRIAGGAINHGVDVRITTWNYNPDVVQTKIGAPVSSQDNRQVRITCFESEVDKLSTDPLIAEGERFIFYRVNFNGTTPTYSYTENDFHDGATVELSCQLDDSQNAIGVHQGWSRKFANFVQNYQ